MSGKRNEGGMFASARRKLTLLLVTIVVVLYVATSLAVYEWMDRLTIAEVDTLLQVSAHSVERRALLFMATAELSGVIPPGNPDVSPAGNALLVIRDAQGQPLYESHPGFANLYAPLLAIAQQSQPALGPGLNAQQVENKYYQTVYWTAGNEPLRVMTIPVVVQGVNAAGYLQIGISMAEQADELARLRQVLFTVGLLGALAALLLGFFASDRALQPIARSWRRQREFVADASHELRTPLAVIQSNLDVVLSHANGSVLDNLEWLSNAKGESRRLSKLTENLLTLARTDSAQAQIERGSVSLLDLIDRAMESLSPFAEMKGLQIREERSPEDPESYAMQGDSERLYQLLVILLDNAIKYTDAGEIVVRLSRQRSTVRLQVEDTGVGIDKEDLPRIFERFFRGDRSRERAQGGTGLGLAIAQWIAEAHGGKIQAQSILGEGSVFTVVLPASHVWTASVTPPAF